jgi:hypothetical protein
VGDPRDVWGFGAVDYVPKVLPPEASKWEKAHIFYQQRVLEMQAFTVERGADPADLREFYRAGCAAISESKWGDIEWEDELGEEEECECEYEEEESRAEEAAASDLPGALGPRAEEAAACDDLQEREEYYKSVREAVGKRAFQRWLAGVSDELDYPDFNPNLLPRRVLEQRVGYGPEVREWTYPSDEQLRSFVKP